MSFRKKKEACDAWKFALIAFVASMKSFDHLKENILVNPMREYIDPVLNALLQAVHSIKLEQRPEQNADYDSCDEADRQYLRRGDQYYTLNNDIQLEQLFTALWTVFFVGSASSRRRRALCEKDLQLSD